MIDTTICTHVVYCYIDAIANGTIILDGWLDDRLDEGLLEKFVDLKEQNPTVKLMVAAGGLEFGSKVFSQIAANKLSRWDFAQNVMKFCQKYNLDGFEISWQYPAQRDGNAAVDKNNFNELLKELKSALSKDGLLLSFAGAAVENLAMISYDIRTVASIVDFINIMAYDFHQPKDGFTGIHGALYAGPNENQKINADAAIKYWISQGAPAKKLILGIPTYGKSFTLANEANNDIVAAVTGAGVAGPFTRQNGILGYNEICSNPRWKNKWQVEQKAPYAIKNNQWVGYDDVNSVSIKAKYINENDLGGAMFWSLETDDFQGKCGQGKYPLIRTAFQILIGEKISASTESFWTCPKYLPYPNYQKYYQ